MTATRTGMSGRDELKLLAENDVRRRFEEAKNFTSTSALVLVIQRLIDINGVMPLPAPMNSTFDAGQSKQLNFRLAPDGQPLPQHDTLAQPVRHTTAGYAFPTPI